LPNPAIIAGEDLSVCAGDEVVLSGAGAGVGGSYSWDGGVVNDVAFVPASTLIYTVTGTDANGCINTDDVLVTVNALPIVDAGADFDICFGDDATIVGAGAGAGGTYVWDAGVIDGVPFTPAATNIYTVIGTDINGCIGSDEIEVTVNALPLIFAGADFDVCEEDMATLTGSGAGIGGTYSWDSGVTDGVGFYPEATAIYVLTGTDENGCVNTDEIEVVVNELPTIEAGEPVVICYGDPVILAGSGAGYGGVYAWDGGVTNGLSFTPAVTATYTLTGTDANGCVNTDNVLVTVNALPAINAGPDYSICIGDDAVLSGSGAGVDGTYSWDGGVFNEVVFNPVITNSYTVTGTDINGCENTDMVIVTVIPLPIISAGPDFAICQGDPTSISASGAGPGGVYTWSGGIFDGLGFSPVSTSTYIVTGTTMDGCTNADTIEVVVNPLPDIAFYGDTLMGCAPLKVNFMSLNPGAVFDWNFGDGSYGTGSTTTHVFNSSGTYNVSLTATSVHGCVASDLIESYVDIARTPVAEFSYNPDEIDISDTRVQFDNSSVDADYYIWNFGDGSSEVTSTNAMHEYEPIGNTNYTVKLIAGSDHGCMDQTEQLIKIKDVLIFHVPNAFTPDGDTFNEEFKPIFVSGYDIFDYHLTIYNQWGERVFESYDANFGWNGTYGGGELVNDGVYVWQIEFGESMSDKRHYEGGHITVLK
jgi:gliding motility-associated-like protein